MAIKSNPPPPHTYLRRQLTDHVSMILEYSKDISFYSGLCVKMLWDILSDRLLLWKFVPFREVFHLVGNGPLHFVVPYNCA